MEALPKEEVKALDMLLGDLGDFRSRQNRFRAPKRRTLRQAVIDSGSLAGFQPLQRQFSPGNTKFWKGCLLLKPAVRVYMLMKQKE